MNLGLGTGLFFILTGRSFIERYVRKIPTLYYMPHSRIFINLAILWGTLHAGDYWFTS